MQTIQQKLKIKKLLKDFERFKTNYNFKYKEIKEINGELFCDDILVADKDGNINAISDKWVNVGYKLKGALSKAISNLFPYEFYFKGKKVASIESVFQGIKFKDKKVQNKVFKYSGIDSNNIKIATDYDWEKTQEVYFQGKSYNRHSKDYEKFVDEIYISALMNPLYLGALKNIGNLYILHSIGETDKNLTVFSRYEFEYILNCLKDFVKTL